MFYPVPKLGQNGACSILHELEEQPYFIGRNYGLSATDPNLSEHPLSHELKELQGLISQIQEQTGADWGGIYKKMQNLEGISVLVKHAYFGAPSRAEFPLTEEFARSSNNSTVGITGKEILVQDVSEYDGPYYQCDAEVQSEFCCPIFDSKGSLAGIIDVESFQAHFFDEEKLNLIRNIAKEVSFKWEFID